MDNYALPIMYKSYHLFKRKFINHKAYQSLEFTNMYLGVIALLQEYSRAYNQAFEKNQELKEKLKIVLDLSR